jgi:exodeoxyribonuclease III
MRLRIVVWNCAMALHEKYEHLLALDPDIAVVPECAEPDVLRRAAPGFAFDDCEWGGTFPTKGLGVFAFGTSRAPGLRLRLHHTWERRFHLFLPIEVRGPVAINLLAVWAFNRRGQKVVPNPGTTADAVAYYRPFLSAAPAVIAGDLNSSARWDKGKRHPTFARTNAALEELGLKSAYHARYGHGFDAEPHPTFLLHRKPEKPFHIDYVYVPTAWLSGLHKVTVHPTEEWRRYSDHAPLVVDCEVPGAHASLHSSSVVA